MQILNSFCNKNYHIKKSLCNAVLVDEPGNNNVWFIFMFHIKSVDEYEVLNYNMKFLLKVVAGLFSIQSSDFVVCSLLCSTIE